MELHTWMGFVLACWIISLSPGAGAIASMTSGLQYGFRRGYLNIFGLQLALMLQIAIVAVGLGAILATSALAFNLIKWFGVCYLVWLAWGQWHAVIKPALDGQTRTQAAEVSRRRLILQGFLVNAGNPKAIVFMLAVLPQFIAPEHPLLPQYLEIMATMVTIDIIVMTGYTGLAARLLRLQTARQQKKVNRTFASLFVGAAALLATVHRA